MRLLRHLRLLSTSSAGLAAASESGSSSLDNGQSSVAKETVDVLRLEPSAIPALVSERRLEYIAVISGSMFTILLVTCAGVALFLVRHRHHRRQRKYASTANCVGVGGRCSESDTLAVAMNRLYPGSDDCGGNEEGGEGGGGVGVDSGTSGEAAGNVRTKVCAKTINGHVYNVVATSDVDSDVGRVNEEMRPLSSSADVEEDDQERRAFDDFRGKSIRTKCCSLVTCRCPR